VRLQHLQHLQHLQQGETLQFLQISGGIVKQKVRPPGTFAPHLQRLTPVSITKKITAIGGL
jgi:hypothetical protein